MVEAVTTGTYPRCTSVRTCSLLTRSTSARSGSDDANGHSAPPLAAGGSAPSLAGSTAPSLASGSTAPSLASGSTAPLPSRGSSERAGSGGVPADVALSTLAKCERTNHSSPDGPPLRPPKGTTAGLAVEMYALTSQWRFCSQLWHSSDANTRQSFRRQESEGTAHHSEPNCKR
jgi:hypothetical protein